VRDLFEWIWTEGKMHISGISYLFNSAPCDDIWGE